MKASPHILTSVITGDIIQSRKTAKAHWLPLLKKTLSLQGKAPHTWEIYRGDSFQVEVRDPAEAFITALRIKSTIKTIRNLDVRMAIGIGKKTPAARKITESDGEAFIHSGEKFETLKKTKVNLAVKTPWPDFDREMNICFRLASIPMDDWTPSSAELMQILTHNSKLTQKTLSKKLDVSQPSISERQHRAHYEEIMELESFFREKIQKLISAK
ncbi:MAG TPA: transcriptional regulator [Chryseosolibacter sp.]